MLLIREVRIIDPVTETDQTADILIEGETICRVGRHLEGISAEAEENGRTGNGGCAVPDKLSIIDGRGLVAAPGLVDGHVHFRDPGQEAKEDIFTGAAAAARGGFTSVVCMANTKPTVDNTETLRYVLEKGRQTGIRIFSAANLTKGMQGKELTDMAALKEAGAVVFTDDGVPVMDEKLLVKGMESARDLDMPVSLHEEDPALMSQPGVNLGEISEKIGYGGASAAAEYVLVARDCMLALHTGAKVCIQHISCGKSVEMVRLARKLGADIHAEATPHHFTLTQEAVLLYGTNARMNPPLRTEQDRQQIIKGLMDGTIDMIATDHAPHTPQEKGKDMEHSPSGIIGLETALGLGIRSLVEPGYLSLMELVRLMSTQPARMYGMEPVSIQAGYPADIVLFDPAGKWTVSTFASRSSNSPFTGWELPGKVHATIGGGRIVYLKDPSA